MGQAGTAGQDHPKPGAGPARPENGGPPMAIALLLIILGVWLIAQALMGDLAARLIGG